MVTVADPGSPTGTATGPTGDVRPPLLETIIAAARASGASDVLMVAVAIVESGLNWDTVGDGGTSFGPFQHHRGGALGNHSPDWAMSPAGVTERAYALIGARTGADAARIQRPADPAGYAVKVDNALPRARQLVTQVDGAGGPHHTGPGIQSYAGQDIGGVTPLGPAQAAGAVAGAAGKAAGAVASLFDWGAARRLVLAGLIVAGGVGLVVAGGYQGSKA